MCEGRRGRELLCDRQHLVSVSHLRPSHATVDCSLTFVEAILSKDAEGGREASLHVLALFILVFKCGRSVNVSSVPVSFYAIGHRTYLGNLGIDLAFEAATPGSWVAATGVFSSSIPLAVTA